MRATWLQLMLEHEESRVGEGQGVDIGPHVALVNSLLQVYRVLGLKRKEPPTPILRDYLAKGENP